jgi:hypothetical protein
MNKNFKLLISSKDAQLYLLAVEDFSMPPSEPVYIVKGKYKLGQGATAVRTAGQNWIEGELTGDSLVAFGVMVGQGEKVPVVPVAPARLESCLQALAEAGFVRVRMAGHDITRQEGTHKYKVSATAPTTLEVAVEESKEGKPPLKATAANISSFIDISAVKKSPYLQIVYKVQYEAAKNRMAIGYPQVHFKKAYRFTKGDFVNLAWQ